MHARMIQSYKDLIVWQKSYQLAKNVYAATESLPAAEIYGLRIQLRRAAISIPSNIAEGSNRKTRKDYAHFLGTAHGSAAELETQLLLSRDLYGISIEECAALLEEVSKMLRSMIQKLTSRN